MDLVENMTLDNAVKLQKIFDQEGLFMSNLEIDVEEITKAHAEFIEWSGNAVMWIDFEDCNVWTDVENPFDYSDSNTIYPIVSKDEMTHEKQNHSVKTLVKLANLKYKYLKDGENDLMINSLDVYDVL